MPVEPSPDPTEVTDALRRQVQEWVRDSIRAQQDPDARQLPAPLSPEEVTPRPAPPTSADKRITYTAAAISGALGLIGSILGALLVMLADDPAPPTPAPVTNCQQQQDETLRIQRDNPAIILRYSGPSEEQCNLNYTAEQERGRINGKPR
ncbi:hypothetical protein [Nocardia fluminea]|uniref:Uncharacterized protein n=1 Tax=Nocardia fluminea TaxID=134984 RepID=A0A2N3VE20_9NOCA|nr:hypothetical protein [Nocardia fluminea]PKV79838.1 hypothetical protein ATK86_4252 [Nocardia fluminea]